MSDLTDRDFLFWKRGDIDSDDIGGDGGCGICGSFVRGGGSGCCDGRFLLVGSSSMRGHVSYESAWSAVTKKKMSSNLSSLLCDVKRRVVFLGTDIHCG